MRKILNALVAAGLMSSLLAIADDTDIYLASNPTSSAPFLMLAMDYRQDMSATFCSTNGNGSCIDSFDESDPVEFLLLQSLDAVVNGEPEGALAGDADGDGLRDSKSDMTAFSATNLAAMIAVFRVVFDKFSEINVGLMIPNEADGGTILRGYMQFQPDDANGAKQGIIDILSTLPLPSTGNAYHETAPKEMHYEWYRYINGMAVGYGASTSANFEGSNTPAPDASIMSGGNYTSPFAINPDDYKCSKFFEVYATSGNEGGGADTSEDANIATSMSSQAASNFESMIRYMSHNDVLNVVDGEQNLKAWMIQMGSSASKTDDWAQATGTYDQYMSVAGGAADLLDLKATLESIFIEALSVSATFVAASVPVNVFNKVEALDNYYIALFESQSTARWPGNLKKLKLVDSDDDGEFDEIRDKLDQQAFSLTGENADGRIKYEALTYWTDARNLPEADATKSEVDGRDGRSVERGGAGQKIPGFIAGTIADANGTGTRQLYTDNGGDLLALNVANASTLMTGLGAADQDEAEAFIRWYRGQDVADEDEDGNVTEARDWILGDSIHSRPLALNYGATTGYSETNQNIRLFMGTNHGFMHIFENTSAAGLETGTEQFAYIPSELLGLADKLIDNSPSVAHPYGVDGEPVALVIDDNNNGTIDSDETAYVYFGLRRGGKSYYALDVSDPDAVPSLLWKITKTSGGDFDELGYTFSTPKVTTVKFEDTARKVLIFAGGYDLKKDDQDNLVDDPDADGNWAADDEGNAIYIVDAETGALIWKVTDGGFTGSASNTKYVHRNLDHSIPSAVSVLDSNSNGITDRLYVGDMSGIVWRVDLPEGTGSSCTYAGTSGLDARRCWSANKFADLDDTEQSATEDRRFFHAPDIVQTKDASGPYDAVIITSGDRANPLETTDENYIFMLKDRNVITGNPPMTQINDDQLADVTDCVTGTEEGCAALDYSKGWRLELEAPGEKGLSSPIVASGAVYVTTYKPNTGNDSCAPVEGEGALYVVKLGNGAEFLQNSRDIDVGPGIPSDVIALDDDTLLLPGKGWDPDLDNVPDKVTPTGGKSIWPLYWRQTGLDNL